MPRFSRALRQRSSRAAREQDRRDIFARPGLRGGHLPICRCNSSTRSRFALPDPLDLSETWREIRAELRRAVGESTYAIWLAALQAREWDGNVLVLEAPVDTKAWLIKRFGRVLEQCAARVLGRPAKLTFVAADGAGEQRDSNPPVEVEHEAVFNPRYSFEQFVIGDGNRLAHASALAVAELPGQAYNPLFLHAPPGLGKTHLLHAIGNYVRAYGGGATVRYTTVESFTNHFISALGTHTLSRFKHAYRDADVLLIDDVQFLASKAKTEEEFFHTFNAVYETGRQLVVTCDRLPRQLNSVQERLVERFESGLVADIRPPDFATRVTILRKRVALDRIALGDPTVLELIAERVSANVRALEGALIRVVAYHSLTRSPIDLELATAVLNTMYPESRPKPVSIGRIQQAVASYFRVSVDDLVSARRASRIAWPRQLAMHLARELTESSLPTIGQEFGGRNHATVLYACRRVENRLREDREASAAVQDITRGLTAGQSDRLS